MTHPNPFAQNVPATEQQAQPAAPVANPYAQQQAAPAQQQYTPPAQQAQAAPNPFAAQQQAAPVAPQAYAPTQQAPQPQYTPHPASQGPYGQTAHVQQPVQAHTPPPAAQHHAAPPALGTASAPPPPPPSGGKGPTLPDMYGRLVIIFPHVVQNVPRRADLITDEQRARGDVSQDRMTATVVVLDGGRTDLMTPIAFGGKPHILGGDPHDQSAPLPYVRKGMWINGRKVIAQVSDYMPGRPLGGPNGTPGAAVGRLVKEAPEQNAAWYLTTPTEQELALANAYLGLVMQGQYPHPLAP